MLRLYAMKIHADCTTADRAPNAVFHGLMVSGGCPTARSKGTYVASIEDVCQRTRFPGIEWSTIAGEVGLPADFPHVRVDLYIRRGEIINSASSTLTKTRQRILIFTPESFISSWVLSFNSRAAFQAMPAFQNGR